MPVETRLQLVLAVLAHEMTVAEAARQQGVSAESINRWRNRFVDAGKAAMEDGMPGKAGSRGSLVERRQRAEIQELKLALAEATVQLRTWQKGSEYVDLVHRLRHQVPPRRQDHPDRPRRRCARVSRRGRRRGRTRSRPRRLEGRPWRTRTGRREHRRGHRRRPRSDRRRLRQWRPPLPRHLQPHPATPSSRRSNAAPGLPRHVTQRPTEGPVTATRHRAGLTRHPVAEDGGRRLRAPPLCRWRFTCETARAASVGALGHGRLPGSYEELVAAR